jgi:hypothetical protein
MQNLAMELGAGETAFILPAAGPDSGRSRLRVFTPAAEIPFGGHSLLGATFALDQMSRRSVDENPDPFTWELGRSNIFLGLSYIGFMDDLSIYNRALTDSEIGALYSLENGVQTILE